MSAPTLTVNSEGDALALASLPGSGSTPTGWHVGLYNASTGPAAYAAVIGDFTEPTDLNYARQEIASFTGPLDDGTSSDRQYLSGAAVTFPAFAAPDTILGRFIVSPDGNLYAFADFALPIAMGPTEPALLVTPALSMKSEI